MGKGAPTRILLDKKQIFPPEYVETIEHLIAWVSSELLPKVRIITQLTVDGHFINLDDEIRERNQPLSNYALIEIETRRIADVAVEALKDAQENFPSVMVDLEEASEAFENGNISLALELFNNAVDYLESFVNLVIAIEHQLVEDSPWIRIRTTEFGKNQVQGVPFETFNSSEKLKEKFVQVKDAYKNQDYKMLTKLIRRELIPLITTWDDELPLIIEKLKMEKSEA